MAEPLYPLRSPSLCSTFIRQAQETWRLLEVGSRYGLLPGEETLTDLNLLRLRDEHPHGVRIQRFSKTAESVAGADWEIWFTDTTNRYIGLRVQAKKLDPSTQQYPEFATPKKRKAALAQARRLISKSRAAPVRCPVYVFYNSWSANFAADYLWHCGTYPPSPRMLGCAVAGASDIKKLITAGAPTLEDVIRHSLPWSCLVCCGGFGNGTLVNRVKSFLDGTFGSAEGMPEPEVTADPPEYVLEAENPDAVLGLEGDGRLEIDISHLLLIRAVLE